MSVASSMLSFGASSSSFSPLNRFQIEEILDDIRIEEGDIELPIVEFSRFRVHEIITQGVFKYYHGYVEEGEANEKSYYAIKCITGSKNFKKALEWIKEARLVAPLKNEHIQNIYAMSLKSLSECLESENHELNVAHRFFLVVDTIQESLNRRMFDWRLNDCHGSMRSSFGGKNNSLGVDRYDAIDRVKLVGDDVAKALVYLHSENVAFGPLTPDKIGYDRHGTLKLTNFSTAQPVDSENSKELYAADIYSFGQLLWQIYTLEEIVPHRPALNGIIPEGRLRELIRQCWDKDIDERPKTRRIPRRLMEATRDARHSMVAAKKETEVGNEFLSELSDHRPPSIRNLFLKSPRGKNKKNFRVSKVDLTLHLLEHPSFIEDNHKSGGCDATVGTEFS